MPVWPRRGVERSWGRSEVALSLVALAALALPLMPIPGDTPAQMEVRFHTADMKAPRVFVTSTMWSACRILAAALTYDDPATGSFTRITCR